MGKTASNPQKIYLPFLKLTFFAPENYIMVGNHYDSFRFFLGRFSGLFSGVSFAWLVSGRVSRVVRLLSLPHLHLRPRPLICLVVGWWVTGWVFPKIMVPPNHQIIHFNRVFHHKPSILGYPYFWKHPDEDDGSMMEIYPPPG